MIRPQSDRWPCRSPHLEPHHGLVHRTDLLYIKAAVREPVAVEDQQIVEHAEYNPVRYPRGREPFCDGPGRAELTPFQERVSIGVKKATVASRQVQHSVATAIVNEATKGDDLRPCSVPLVHRVRVEGCVFPQALKQAGNGVVAEVHGVCRKQTAVLGVQHENKAHQRGEQRAVYIGGGVAQNLPEQLAVAGLIRGLEAAH